MIKICFKSNSTSQNQLVKWVCTSLIYYEIVLSLVDIRLPTHPLTLVDR